MKASRWVFLSALLIAARVVAVPVEISGVDEPQRSNVLAHLSLDDEPCEAPGWRIDRLAERAPEEIGDAMEAVGYYGSVVEVRAEPGETCAAFHIEIFPGDPVRLRTVDITITGAAQSDPAFRELRGQNPATPGEVLRHGPLAQWKRALSDLALERGYPDAGFTESRLDVYPADHAADLVLRFDPGERYRFGDLVLEQSVLEEPFLLRYVDFRPGDPYDRQKLRDLYVALVGTGYFDSVVVRPLEARPETLEIPVKVQLTPSKPKTYSIGGGLSTDTGPLLRLGYLNRRANKRGWQRGAELALSPVFGELVGNVRIPVGDPRTRWLAFSGGVKYEDSDSVQSRSFQTGARHVGLMRGRWRETQFIDLLYEDYRVADQEDTSRLLIPGLNWVRKHADSVIFPHDGYRMDFTVKGAWDGLVSDTNFVQAIADLKAIVPAPADGRFMARMRAARTAVGSVSDLPASLRFFAGGDNSVRGYAYQSLGPENADGDVIGGTGLLIGSLEYEVPFRPSWGLALFVDTGNAFNGSRFDAKTGVGAGVRWHSPVGPLRFDLAFPLDDSKDSFQIHISLGPDL